MEKVSDILKTLVKKPQSNAAVAGQLSFDAFTRQQEEKAAGGTASKKCGKSITASDPAPVYTLQPYASTDLALIAREFALMGLPHSDPGELPSYSRQNGRFTLRITADQESLLRGRVFSSSGPFNRFGNRPQYLTDCRPIIRGGFSSQAQSPELSMTCRGYCLSGVTEKVS